MSDTLTACDFKLAMNLGSQCGTPSVSGLKNTAYIINYDDVDWDNIQQAGNVVSSFPLKTGKKAYSAYVPGKSPFTGTQKAMTEGTYRNKFEKTFSLVILDNGADVCNKIIDQLANGKFVVIVENKFQGSSETKNNTFEFYGLEQGLSASEITDEKYSEDTDGGWAVSLKEENAPSSGIFFYTSSVSATRTAVESLLTAASGS